MAQETPKDCWLINKGRAREKRQQLIQEGGSSKKSSIHFTIVGDGVTSSPNLIWSSQKFNKGDLQYKIIVSLNLSGGLNPYRI